MRTFYKFLTLFIAATLGFSVNASETPWLDAISQNLRSEGVFGVSDPLNLRDRMQHHGVPGVAVAVIRDGRLAETGGFGVLQTGSAGQVNANTLFSMGSVSKVVAAVLVHRMQEESLLSLDVDVRDYLTSWQFPQNSPDGLVSLRRLLSHTAGFNIHGFGDFEPGAALPSVYDTLNGAYPARHGPLRFIAAPGSRYQYSGGGYTLAQLVMTDIAQMEFPLLAREKLFDPVGMRRSTYANPLPEAVENVAKAHNGRGRPVALPRGYEAMPEMAASGLWSSANEMGHLISLLIRSYRGENDLLTPAATQKMMQRVEPGEHGSGPRIEGEGNNRRFIHGGANNSYRAWIEGHLASGHGLVVLTNSADGDGLYREIRRGWRMIEGQEF